MAIPLLGLKASAAAAGRGGVFRRILPADPLPALLAKARQSSDRNFFDEILGELDISVSLGERDLERIPRDGPLVVVANRPFGILDSVIAAAVCLRVRRDVKLLAHQQLAPQDGWRDYLVDSVASAAQPARAAAGALEWLGAGHALVAVPAVDVARLDLRRRGAVDPEWDLSVARIIRSSGAAVVPVFLRGSNGAGFHLLGIVHPGLRARSLNRELVNKRGRAFEARIGQPLRPDSLAQLTDGAMTAHLRARIYLLGHQPSRRRPRIPPPVHRPLSDGVHDCLEALPSRHVLVDSREWTVFSFRGGDYPRLLELIGRLREEAFRAAGEGSGRTSDVDRFDNHYEQLVLWSKSNREIAGGYRLGFTEDILPRYSIEGLYTSTLFRFQPEFFRRIGPAIELGRSFVAPAYQKQYSPLLALWQGIGAHIGQRPACRILFGAVSVSADYQELSRRLMASSLLQSESDPELAPLVEARTPLKQVFFPTIGDEWRSLVIRGPEELSELLQELEPDAKGLPILLRQYLRLGGRLLAFSLDRGFSSVVDGLIVVDLLRTEPVLLERYLTKARADRFRAFHAGTATTVSPRPDLPSTAPACLR